MKTPIALVFLLHNILARSEGIIAQLSSHITRPREKKNTASLSTKRRVPQPFESSAAWHRNEKIMRQMLLPLKGRTIRKVMGGGGGEGKKPKKNSCKGNCQEKKFVQRRR